MYDPNTPSRIAVALGAITLVLGLSGCITVEASDDDPSAEAVESAADTAGMDTDTTDGIDPRLEALVGTWDGLEDYDEYGPHVSKLTIEEDGTATYQSPSNLQYGPYEGEIILGSAETHRFEGAISEDDYDSDIVVEFEYDAEADVVMMTNDGSWDGAREHVRAD